MAIATGPNIGVTGASRTPSKLIVNVGRKAAPMVTNNAVIIIKAIGGIALGITGGILWAVTHDSALGQSMLAGGIGLMAGTTVQAKETGE